MKFLVYGNKIVLYLTLDEYDKDSLYSYYLNEQLIKKDKITNFTFNNLDYDTSYHICVLKDDSIIFEQDIITSKKKEDVIVKVSDNKGNKVITKEIQSFLDNANSNNRIVFPKGTYLCGALFIKSDTEIYLQKDAVILGSVNAKDYLPKIKSRFEGHNVMSYASLINIGELEHNNVATTFNVKIYGEGMIYGGDKELRKDMLLLEKDHPVINDRFRNRLINISNSSNVIIDGLHIGKSACWNIHPVYSNHIYIHHCDFVSGGLPNGDGIDPDSCHDMDIFSNVFFVGDDCIAIKSGKNPDGNIVNIPCYNISVFDCLSLGSHGFAIGSEISGGVYNVDVFNCDFNKSIFGIHIKTTLKRGGYVKNVRVKNVLTSTIQIHSVNYNDDGEPANTITEFSNFSFDDITILGDSIGPDGRTYELDNILVDGFKDYPTFKDIYFNDIKIKHKKGITINNATNCVINNVKGI